jgi:hypothetical protein
MQCTKSVIDHFAKKIGFKEMNKAHKKIEMLKQLTEYLKDHRFKKRGHMEGYAPSVSNPIKDKDIVEFGKYCNMEIDEIGMINLKKNELLENLIKHLENMVNNMEKEVLQFEIKECTKSSIEFFAKKIGYKDINTRERKLDMLFKLTEYLEDHQNKNIGEHLVGYQPKSSNPIKLQDIIDFAKYCNMTLDRMHKREELIKKLIEHLRNVISETLEEKQVPLKKIDAYEEWTLHNNDKKYIIITSEAYNNLMVKTKFKKMAKNGDYVMAWWDKGYLKVFYKMNDVVEETLITFISNKIKAVKKETVDKLIEKFNLQNNIAQDLFVQGFKNQFVQNQSEFFSFHDEKNPRYHLLVFK